MKTYNNKTNHSDFSLLTCIVTHVWDVDKEIKHTHSFVAKIVQNSPPFYLFKWCFYFPFLCLEPKLSCHLYYCVKTTWQQTLDDQKPLLVAT